MSNRKLPADADLRELVRDTPFWEIADAYGVTTAAIYSWMHRVGMKIRHPRRGFLSMTLERRRDVASAGGKAAHERGTAHEFTPEEARAAGRKGGEAVSRSREHMARIGSAGGSASVRSKKNDR